MRIYKTKKKVVNQIDMVTDIIIVDIDEKKHIYYDCIITHFLHNIVI